MEAELPADQLECTLAIIKPDAVERGLIGVIVKRIEDERFTICLLYTSDAADE